jgi:hypothetical protein
MATMPTTTPLSDAEIATRVLQHPAALVFSRTIAVALDNIANRQGSTTDATDRRLLEQALATVQAAELAAAGGPT